MPINISETIRSYLENYYKSGLKYTDAEYQEIFKAEGLRKAQYILDYLGQLQSRMPGLDLSKFVYLSIGGADGSEIEEVFAKTNLVQSVLVEYSTEAGQLADKKSIDLKNKTPSKNMTVIRGDVTERLNEIFDALTNLKSQGIEGVIVSCQAVLHELPSRSPKFNDRVFWATLLDVFPNSIIVIKEPCVPTGWANGADVDLTIRGVESEDLFSICDLICKNVPGNTKVTPQKVGRSVRLPPAMAVECVHKILRTRNIGHFKYELGEILTSFQPKRAAQVLFDYLKKQVIVHYINTDGFEHAWVGSGVEVMEDGVSIPMLPTTHCIIRGYNLDSLKNVDVKVIAANGLSSDGVVDSKAGPQYSIQKEPEACIVRELPQGDVIKLRILTSFGRPKSATKIARALAQSVDVIESYLNTHRDEFKVNYDCLQHPTYFLVKDERSEEVEPTVSG